ncbi:hypothetical protein MRX96_048373 [Rhipicephalus microplus]
MQRKGDEEGSAFWPRKRGRHAAAAKIRFVSECNYGEAVSRSVELSSRHHCRALSPRRRFVARSEPAHPRRMLSTTLVPHEERRCSGAFSPELSFASRWPFPSPLVSLQTRA